MVDPVFFSIFGWDVYWYGVAYALMFLFAYFFSIFYCDKFDFKRDFIEDVFFYGMIFSVIGGRVFYILFYDLTYYLSNPIKVFFVWEGGMSIHGGLFFGILVCWYFAKKEGVSVLKLFDLFVVPIAFGLAFGRLANFVNQELVGRITMTSLGLVFPLVDDLNRWPYQLFAGFKNLIVFEILYFLFVFRKLKYGVLSMSFLVLYSFGRFFTDFFREPTIAVGIISVGQILSLVYGFVALFILVWLMFFRK